MLRQLPVAQQVLHCQVLNAYRLVLTNEAGGQFLEKVLALVSDPFFLPGNFDP